MVKRYVIVAGINGAGKSSFYKLDTIKKNPLLSNSIRVNPDEIIRNAGQDWKNTSAQTQAARQAARMLKNLLAGEDDFHREMILAGGVGSHKMHIAKAKKNGFHVHLIYIALENVELSKKRIAERVSKGGHGIPDNIVEKRYGESLRNLKEVLPLVDEVDVFDNSTDGLKLVYSRNERFEINKSYKFPYLIDYIG